MPILVYKIIYGLTFATLSIFYQFSGRTLDPQIHPQRSVILIYYIVRGDIHYNIKIQ